MSERILIVEDQYIEAHNLKIILERAGHTVCGIARSVAVALEAVDNFKPDLVLIDIFLKGDLTGIDLAQTLKKNTIPFIYLSANSNRQTLEAAKATRPYGFLVKPFREKDVLIMIEVARHLHEHSLDAVIRKSEERKTLGGTESVIPKESNVNRTNKDDFKGIIGRSPKLLRTLEHLRIVAPTETSVLVLGESGTGKERVAECIHELSHRKNGPLVKVDCATLPANLIESVLLGHEKGSFTGASERRIGKFEQAHGGTIFLDEVGEIPLEIQSKLLRVLQEKEVERIGGKEIIKVDVRIVAATNRNLEKEVAEGRFRMDLYYRLNVFPLHVPPLRDRTEDIPLLVRSFTDYYAKRIAKSIAPVSVVLMHQLMSYQWPGNIRQLQHVMERAVLLANDDQIKIIELPDGHSTKLEVKPKTKDEAERDHILAVLTRCNGKVFGKGGAAEALGIPPSTLNSRLKKLGIEKETMFKV